MKTAKLYPRLYRLALNLEYGIERLSVERWFVGWLIFGSPVAAWLCSLINQTSLTDSAQIIPLIVAGLVTATISAVIFGIVGVVSVMGLKEAFLPYSRFSAGQKKLLNELIELRESDGLAPEVHERLCAIRGRELVAFELNRLWGKQWDFNRREELKAAPKPNPPEKNEFVAIQEQLCPGAKD